MGDKTMSVGIDILRVVGSEKYGELCRSEGVTRMFDVQDATVLRWHVEYCKLTRARAKAIMDRVSAFNLNNVSRQINCGYSVSGDTVTMHVNGVSYSQADFADVCYHVQRLGVKVPLVFDDITQGVETCQL